MDPQPPHMGAVKRTPPPTIIAPRSLAFVIPGAPRTKKNSQQVARLPDGSMRIVPSKAYREWLKLVRATLPRASGGRFTVQLDPRIRYNVAAVFHRHADTGDAVGYYQGLADVLEDAGLTSNDRQFTQWDGSRLAVSRFPRTDVTLTRIG